MPTRLPARRATPRDEPVPVKFLLIMFAVACAAIVLSATFVKHPGAPDSYAGDEPRQTVGAIGIAH
jgi:hypothetical protein